MSVILSGDSTEVQNSEKTISGLMYWSIPKIKKKNMMTKMLLLEIEGDEWLPLFCFWWLGGMQVYWNEKFANNCTTSKWEKHVGIYLGMQPWYMLFAGISQVLWDQISCSNGSFITLQRLQSLLGVLKSDIVICVRHCFKGELAGSYWLLKPL